ncbi:hypothetical protein EMN47_17680 [Prolixibacteraceae bacterium JC049]|nr:hypothetical protein [Prolixibacteraceae bacterium JC049]
MNCSQNELLQAYADGELDAANRFMVEQHLLHCSNCKQELETILQLRDLLKNRYETDSSKEIPPFNYPPKRKLYRQAWIWWGATAAMLVIALTVYLQVPTMEKSSTSDFYIEFETYTDANKPIDEQPLELVIIESNQEQELMQSNF